MTALEERKESGNWTRGLEWEMRQMELENAGELPIRRTPDAKARTIVRRRMRFPVFTAIGALAAAGLAVMLLLSCIELTRLSSETASLKNKLDGLKSENVSLMAEYDQTFDLATIKEAAEAAGMSKPSSSQIIYVDLAGEDIVEIYRQEDAGVLNSLVLSAKRAFDAVREYFD